MTRSAVPGNVMWEEPMEEYEVNLRDYLRVLWQGKWIVLVTFLVAVGTALGISYSLPKQYQTETGLLILPPLAREIGGEIGGTVFSPETYKSLALASDLLQEAIDTVYAGEDRPTVENLKRGMRVEVEQTTAKDFPGRFPLYLRLTVKGTDPQRLQALAEAWAQHFIARNAQLFMSRAAQSYDYVKQNFEEVEQELLAKEEERKLYQQENPEPIIQAEVSQLQEIYQSYLALLAEKRRELISEEARLAVLEEALAQEPEHFTLERGLSREALWHFLAEGLPEEALGAIPRLQIQDQVLNAAYVNLRSEVAGARAQVQSLREEVAYLEAELEATLRALTEKQAQLVEVQAELDRLDREISVLRNSYSSLATKLQEARIAQAETAEPIRVVEAPVVPTTPVGPNKKTNVAMAGVLSLFLGILLAFVFHYLESGDEESSQASQGEGPDEVA